MQQAVHRYNARQGDDRLRVRVGLNVGEPIRDEDDYFGTPVVVAKRLCDTADGGQILASELLRALVGSRGSFGFRSCGPIALKGLSEPLPACEIAWEPAVERRVALPAPFLADQPAPLVGRDAQLAGAASRLAGCQRASGSKQRRGARRGARDRQDPSGGRVLPQCLCRGRAGPARTLLRGVAGPLPVVRRGRCATTCPRARWMSYGSTSARTGRRSRRLVPELAEPRRPRRRQLRRRSPPSATSFCCSSASRRCCARSPTSTR